VIGVKLHLRVTFAEPGIVYPDKAVVTNAQSTDHPQMEVLIDEADATHLMDRGCGCHRSVTNRFDLTTEEIGYLYRSRWQIEIFFRWVKQNLKMTCFYGTDGFTEGVVVKTGLAL
jgi:IS4 transposase